MLPETTEPLPLSGLEHLAFCPQQWALIHLEQAWKENRLTAEGRRLRRIARLCENHGQRVQNSVFECLVDPSQW
jgi:hypothetical protein